MRKKNKWKINKLKIRNFRRVFYDQKVSTDLIHLRILRSWRDAPRHSFSLYFCCSHIFFDYLMDWQKFQMTCFINETHRKKTPIFKIKRKDLKKKKHTEINENVWRVKEKKISFSLKQVKKFFSSSFLSFSSRSRWRRASKRKKIILSLSRKSSFG